MIQNSSTAWLLCVALTLIGFGSSAGVAIAHTTYPLEATYNAEITTTPLEETDARIVFQTSQAVPEPKIDATLVGVGLSPRLPSSTGYQEVTRGSSPGNRSLE